MTRTDLAAGIGLGAVIALALAGPAVDAVRTLDAARELRAERQAMLAAPPAPARPLLEPALAWDARDRAGATRMLIARLRGAAASGGILVETLRPAAAEAPLVSVTVRLSGPEKAMIALIDGIERGTPLTRFRAWRIEGLADGSVRVEGELVAAWR